MKPPDKSLYLPGGAELMLDPPSSTPPPPPSLKRTVRLLSTNRQLNIRTSVRIFVVWPRTGP